MDCKTYYSTMFGQDKLHTSYSSLVFFATFEQAKELARLAGLDLIAHPDGEWENPLVKNADYRSYNSRSYWGWEDHKYGGGLCRITWQPDSQNMLFGDGIMWISNHSGYERFETYEYVAEWAEQIMELKPISREDLHIFKRDNPRTYNDYDKYGPVQSRYYHEGD